MNSIERSLAIMPDMQTSNVQFMDGQHAGRIFAAGDYHPRANPDNTCDFAGRDVNTTEHSLFIMPRMKKNGALRRQAVEMVSTTIDRHPNAAPGNTCNFAGRDVNTTEPQHVHHAPRMKTNKDRGKGKETRVISHPDVPRCLEAQPTAAGLVSQRSRSARIDDIATSADGTPISPVERGSILMLVALIMANSHIASFRDQSTGGNQQTAFTKGVNQ